MKTHQLAKLTRPWIWVLFSYTILCINYKCGNSLCFVWLLYKMFFPCFSKISKRRWKIWPCYWQQEWNNFILIGAKIVLPAARPSRTMAAEESERSTVTLAFRHLRLALLRVPMSRRPVASVFQNRWLRIIFLKKTFASFAPLLNLKKLSSSWTAIGTKDFPTCMQGANKGYFAYSQGSF